MGNYLNLVWMGLSSAGWFAFLGLIVGLGLVLLLYKRKYLERNNAFLKLLTNLYFIYFPVVFFFSFWFSGSLWMTLKLFENEITEVIDEIEEERYPVFIKFINERVDEFLERGSIPSNQEIVSLFVDENLDQNTSNIYQYSMRLSLTTLLEYMTGKDSEKEKRIRILSEGVSTSFFEQGFDFLKKEVNRRVMALLMVLLIPIVLGFLGALFFPMVEIFVSNRYLKRME